MEHKKELDLGIKELHEAMQELEKECHKSAFSSSLFEIDLKKLEGKIKVIGVILKKMIEEKADCCSSDRVQVLREVLVVFERKANYFLNSHVPNKEYALKECQRLQSAFQVFTQVYESFV